MVLKSSHKFLPCNVYPEYSRTLQIGYCFMCVCVCVCVFEFWWLYVCWIQYQIVRVSYRYRDIKLPKNVQQYCNSMHIYWRVWIISEYNFTLSDCFTVSRKGIENVIFKIITLDRRISIYCNIRNTEIWHSSYISLLKRIH